jgi:hypothetical protein
MLHAPQPGKRAVERIVALLGEAETIQAILRSWAESVNNPLDARVWNPDAPAHLAGRLAIIADQIYSALETDARERNQTAIDFGQRQK